MEDVPKREWPLELAPLMSDDPSAVLDEILDELHACGDDEDQIMMIGVGPLESLFHQGREESLWPRIEELARRDPAFRRALRSAWAYSSPMFDRRQALLAELGEFREVTVRFVAEPQGFPTATSVSWRAFESEGGLTPLELATLLRSIADWLETESSTGDDAG